MGVGVLLFLGFRFEWATLLFRVQVDFLGVLVCWVVGLGLWALWSVQYGQTYCLCFCGYGLLWVELAGFLGLGL